MLPKIGSYARYQSPGYGRHTLWVDLGKIVLYYSYDTIIAFSDDTGLFIRENEWGPTTGRHLNMLDPGRGRIRLTGAEFAALLEKALERHGIAP